MTSMFLTQAELDQMRKEQRQSIEEIGGFGDIRRPTLVPGTHGGSTVTFDVQENVPMRIWISSGPNGTSEEAKFWGNQERMQTDAFLVVAWDTDIQPRDNIVYRGRSWEVVGLQHADTFHTAIRARLEAMRNDHD